MISGERGLLASLWISGVRVFVSCVSKAFWLSSHVVSSAAFLLVPYVVDRGGGSAWTGVLAH